MAHIIPESLYKIFPFSLLIPNKLCQLQQLFDKFGQQSKGVVYKRGMENMLGKWPQHDSACGGFCYWGFYEGRGHHSPLIMRGKP